MITPLYAAQLIAADYASASWPVVDAVPVVVIETLALAGVHASILQIGLERVLLIRGTDEVTDWLRYNLEALPPQTYDGDHCTWHRGFLHHAQIAYAFAKGKGVTLVIGHSLGAAAMQIAAPALGVPGMGFASPRPLFGQKLPTKAELVTNYCRPDDLVTRLPPTFMGFNHVGKVEWLHLHGVHLGEDHRIAHYLELFVLQSASMETNHGQG